MPLHLIKLCVGVDSVEELRAWRAQRAAQGHRSVCPTRQTPKRAAELLQGGSLYWVIKGQVLVRQTIDEIVTLDSGRRGDRAGTGEAAERAGGVVSASFETLA